MSSLTDRITSDELEKIINRLHEGGIVLTTRGGKKIKSTPVYSIVGSRIALANLLGQPQDPKEVNRMVTSFYPSGRVIWQADFESNRPSPKALSEFETATGDGFASLSSDHAFSGGKSMRMMTSPTGASEVNEVLSLVSKPRGAIRFGFEGKFGIESATGIGAIIFGLEDQKNSSQKFNAYIQLNVNFSPANQVKVVSDSLGAGVYSAEGTWVPDTFGYWHTFKLIIDTDKETYIGLYLDNQFFDLTHLTLNSTTGAGNQHKDGIECFIEISKSTNDTGFRKLWVDDLIMTVED